MRNDTDPRDFEIFINGKTPDNSYLWVRPLECIEGVCQIEAIDEVELEEGQRLWSSPESWSLDGETPGVVPVAGDEVEIRSGWNMLYDLDESPPLESLTINGRLSFVNNG